MLKIRLQKVGKKNAPSYRVVLCEHTAPPQGKFIEILGFYNARLKKKGFKKDRIEYWLSKGAQSSPTVHNLLIDEGVLKGIKLKAWRPKEKKEKPIEKPVEVSTKEEKEESKKKEDKPVASESKQAGPPASTQRGEPKSEGFGGEEKPKEAPKAEKSVEEAKEEKKEEETLDKE